MWTRLARRQHVPPQGHRWSILRRLMLQLAAAAVLLAACGVVYWWLEPKTSTLTDALWLAFVTASTIGYGDLVPSTPLSRLFTVFVVLIGFGVLSLMTAAIAATFVETQERRIEREILRDLHRQLKALREEIAGRRSLAPLVRRVRRPIPRGDAGQLGSGPALGPRRRG